MDLKLSVLDQSPISEGSTGAQALHNTLDLARAAERLGYRRHWVAEHHGGPMLAGASPEVLIPAIASVTEHIRVGSAGVMLPHYSPLKVAESFSILSGLFPGRVDLGIGRAAGTDPMTTFALQRDRRQAQDDDFPAQLSELLAWLEGAIPADHPFARIEALPGRPESPTPWLLGSSPQSGIWAAELGLPYAFADFINPRGADIARAYHRDFQPGTRADASEVAVAVWALAADSEEEAEHLASSSRMAISLLRRGRLIAIPTPEKAAAFLRSDTAAGSDRRAILGTGEQVREGLEAVARDYGAGEVVVVTITHDHAARLRSYELIADAFGLSAATAAEHAAAA